MLAYKGLKTCLFLKQKAHHAESSNRHTLGLQQNCEAHFIAPLTTMTQKFPLTIYHQKGSKLKQLQYVYHIDVILSYNMTTIM